MKQTNDALEKSITFSPDSFFWEGVWDGGTVNDAEYTDRRYAGTWSMADPRTSGGSAIAFEGPMR